MDMLNLEGEFPVLKRKNSYHASNRFQRLHLLQWLWKTQLGWDLHPAIQLPSKGEIHVADFGCGNG